MVICGTREVILLMRALLAALLALQKKKACNWSSTSLSWHSLQSGDEVLVEVICGPREVMLLMRALLAVMLALQKKKASNWSSTRLSWQSLQSGVEVLVLVILFTRSCVGKRL